VVLVLVMTPAAFTVSRKSRLSSGGKCSGLDVTLTARVLDA
jgi:hypothetical protein